MTDERTMVPAWVEGLPFHVVKRDVKREKWSHLWLVSIETTRRAGTGDGFPITLGQISYNNDWVCCEHGGDGPVEVIGLAIKRVHRYYLDQLDFDPSPDQRVILAQDYARAVRVLAGMYEAAVEVGVKPNTPAPKPLRWVPFRDLALGAKFKTSDDPESTAWVKIGPNQVAQWQDRMAHDCWIGQFIGCFSDKWPEDPKALDALVVALDNPQG